MSDKIYIHGLQIETVIGVHDWERKQKQTVRIDLEMAVNIQAAAASDNLEDALDYEAIANRLIKFVEASDCQLLETLAENAAQLLLKEFSMPWLRLRLSKPKALPAAADTGIIIERGTLPKP